MRAPILVPFVNNATLLVEQGMTGATGCIYCGIHEFEDMALLLHFLRPEDLFIDVGANVGTYSVLATVVSKSRCLSIEPVPATFFKLQRNLAINGAGSLSRTACVAIGEGEGRIRFSADRDTMNKDVPPDYYGPAIDVNVTTLDSLLNGDCGVMWKVDVEGQEGAVLRGAKRSLSDPRLKVLIMEGHSPQVRATLEAEGFHECTYDPFHRALTRCTPGAGSRLNSLWIRDVQWVQERCRTAERFRTAGFDV